MIWLAGIVALIAAVAAVHVARTTLVRMLYGDRILREVRVLFGPGAEITRIEIDSRWRLVLAGKRLRIPGDLWLDATQARLRGIGRPESIVVESLEGVLRWRGLVAPVTYRVAEQPAAPVDGSLVSRGATWREGAPPFDFEGTVKIARNDYTVTASKVSCSGAVANGLLKGTDGPPRATVHAEGIDAPLLTHLVALVATHPLAVPKAARSSGDLVIEPDFARKLDMVLETRESKLALALRASGEGEIKESRLTGTASFADALEARIFTVSARPRPVGTGQVDFEVRGTTRSLVLAGPVRAPRVEVEAGPVVLVLEQAVSTIEVDERGLRWSAFEAAFLGGRLRGSGTLEGRAHASDIELESVKVEELPLGVKDPLLRGFLTGRLTVRGQGDDRDSLEGEGEAEVREPVYELLRPASASLQAYGLPSLPARGTQPLRARVRLGGGRIVLPSLDGRVEGMRFDGAVDLAWSGALGGRIDARLEHGYLSRSVLLALPSILTGEVTVPLRISGRAGTPTYEADLMGTIGRLVANNPVTGAIGGIVDGIFDGLLGGGRRDDDGKDGKRKRPAGGLGGFLDSLTG